MNRILLFGGTTEGRLLAEWCMQQKIPVTVCVATEYGSTLVEPSEYVEVETGRKTEEQMFGMLLQGIYRLVIDATHPYAVEVTANIASACRQAGIPCYRVIREPEPEGYGCYVDSLEEAIAWLNQEENCDKTLLVTTGSKEAEKLTQIKNFASRCVLRFLPDETIRAQCEAMGFRRERMILEQGPFSEESNISHIRQFRTDVLLTKDSGSAGGFQNKIQAAKACGIWPLIIRRPVEDGYTVEQVKELVKKKQIYIVGIGMDAENTMTVQGQKVVRRAQLLIGAKRMLEAFSHLSCAKFEAYDSGLIEEKIRTCSEQEIVVVMSGDCGFYSGCRRLVERLKDELVTVVSAISSPVYFSSCLQIPWQDWHMLSLHGVNQNIACHVAAHPYTFFLLGGSQPAEEVCRHLTEYELGDVEVFIGENLGTPEEKITKGMAKELQHIRTSKLAVMLVHNEEFTGGLLRGIPDEAFIRGRVPMTKEEIRSIVLSKLCINRTDVCWDIGSGTGSVTVEMALSCPDGTVCAVEKNEEVVELSQKNFRKFHCDNIVLKPGKAADVIADFPAPDCVFIGGSTGQMQEIVRCAVNKNPKVHLVATAVSLETIQEAQTAFAACNREAEVIQAAVTRTVRRGAYTMFDALNPIVIFDSKPVRESVIKGDA